jgi:opacity protein-like surface antigen
MSALGKAYAVRSSGFANEALYFNPAGMSQVQMYSIEGGYTYLNEVVGHYADVSIVDSVTNQYVAAGLAYAYIDSNQPVGFDVGGSDTRIAHQLRAALSSGYRGQDFSAFVGVGMRWMNLTLGDREAVDPVTMDVGALVVIKNVFRVGIVGHNLIEHPDERNELPRQLGVGASFFTSGFLAAFDALVDFDTVAKTKAIYSLGLEYDVASMLPIRAGYQYTDLLERHRITVGLGYYSQVFAVDVGYMQDVSSEDKSDATVGVDLRFFLP